MDEQAVDRSLELDPGLAAAALLAWRELIEAAVWGDLKAAAPALLPRVRKRALETGERLRSMFASRAWIPHPRERLKNALASFVSLRRSLEDLERAVEAVEGGDALAGLRSACAELRRIAARLEPAAVHWAALLESQYREEGE